MVFWHRQQAGWNVVTGARRPVTAVGLLLMVILILCACGGTVSPAPLTQTAGDLSATLEIVPYPPPIMQDTMLVLTLRDAGDSPVSGASVMFDLTMPAMEMPENRPEATEEEAGVYRTDAIFTMSGEWRIDVEVVNEEAREVFTFLINTE
jgi:hypothetical protein